MTDLSGVRMARLLAAALGLAILVAACGGGEGSPCPAEAPSPAPAAPHADDPELAERIPDEAGGEPLEIQTVCATVLNPGGIPTSEAMLERLGVGLQDVTVAFSPPPTADRSGTYVGVTAWRYAGAGEDEVRSAFLAILDEAQIAVEEDTVGGKDVHRAIFHAYYVKDDALYSVIGEEPEMAEVLEALP